nr:aspartate aminotransferase family protein [Gammaproteobacteria bacterium]
VVDFGSEELNLKIMDAVQKDSTCWVGQTIWKGITAMRISVSNWQTNSQDVEESLNVILKIAEEIKGK